MPRSGAEAAEMVALLQCEPPNARLHSFEGRLSFHALDGARLCRDGGMLRMPPSPASGLPAALYAMWPWHARHKYLTLRCSVLLSNDKSCCSVNRCRIDSGACALSIVDSRPQC